MYEITLSDIQPNGINSRYIGIESAWNQDMYDRFLELWREYSTLPIGGISKNKIRRNRFPDSLQQYL